MEINYSTLPPHMQDGFRRYIEQGIPGGSFMTAVLSNNLMEAMNRADEINRARLFDICAFLHNQAPIGCWGSFNTVREWIDQGGMEGRKG